MSSRSVLILVLSVAGSAAPARSAAQQFGYVTTLGSDTLALERYEQRGHSIVGDYATVTGGILIHHYLIHVNDDGAIDRLSMTIGRRNARAHDSLDVALRHDTAVLFDSRWPERVRVMRAPGFFPMFVGVNALEETAANYARRRRSDSLTIPIFAVWANFDTAHFRVLIYAPDSIGLWSRVTPGLLKLGADGHVLRASARLTTTRTETVAVPPFDLGRTLAAMRDAPPGDSVSPFASLSPRDSLRATIGGVRVKIVYGRPALRGRTVFAHGVLGDSIWRTGANGPTEFETSGDLNVAGVLLHAGRYSIWTRVGPDNASYSLTLSTQLGRGCLDYRPQYDVLTVPFQVATLPTAVDRLTIAVEPGQEATDRGDSHLAIRWGMTQLQVSVSAAKRNP